MRRWVRIPAAVLLVLAVFLVPWSETEVHKRRCQSAWNTLHGKSVIQRIKGLYYKVTRGTPRGFWNEDVMRELRDSRDALVELGYLVRQRFVLNDPTEAKKAFYRERPEDAFTCVEWHWGNNLVIIAPRSEMAAVSNLVMRIDERVK